MKKRADLLLLLALAACLLTPRLAALPQPWFDEGYKLNAVRTLAEQGAYATSTVRGRQYFDPSITTGPISIVPLAISFRLFGAGMLPARLTIVAFAFVALVALHGLARRLYGRRAATLIALAVLATPEIGGVSFVLLGRQVLGEMPAIAMTLVGFCLWYDAWESGRAGTGAAAGVAFALALLAKMPIAFGLVPALAVTGVERARRVPAQRGRSLWPIALALALVAGWQMLEHLGRGAAARADDLAVLGDAIFSNLLAPRFGAQLRRSGWLVALFLALAAGGALAHLWRALRSGRLDDRKRLELALALTSACAAAWFVIASTGWVRYVCVPFVLAQILLGGWARRAFLRFAPAWSARARLRFHALAAAGLALTAVAVHVPRLLPPADDGGAAAMAAYIREHVPRDAVIESWEWQIDALSGHWRFSHPHQRYLFEAIRQQAGSDFPEIRGYDALAADPDFLLRGPFADWTHIYDGSEAAFSPEVRIGRYALHRRLRAAEPPP